MTDHRDYVTVFIRHYPLRKHFKHELVLRYSQDSGYAETRIPLEGSAPEMYSGILGIQICDNDPKLDARVHLPLFGMQDNEKGYMITLFMFWLRNMQDCGIIAETQIEAIRLFYQMDVNKKTGKL